MKGKNIKKQPNVNQRNSEWATLHKKLYSVLMPQLLFNGSRFEKYFTTLIRIGHSSDLLIFDVTFDDGKFPKPPPSSFFSFQTFFVSCSNSGGRKEASRQAMLFTARCCPRRPKGPPIFYCFGGKSV